jgi:hypothetical protein
MRNREEIKRDIIGAFYNGNEEFSKLSNSEILNYINENDPDSFKILNDFLIILDAYIFTKTDMDLKLKADDIWRQQIEMYKGLIKDRKASLINLAESKSIEINSLIQELNV